MDGRRGGALVGVVAIVAAGIAWWAVPAAAVTVVDEAGFRAAWTNAAETEIVLDADITFSDCGAGEPTRNSGTPLTIVGNGHTLRQTCANQRVLRQDDSGDITLENLTLTGGSTAGNGAGIFALGDVVATDVIVTDNTAQQGGAGIRAGGGITVTRATVSGNTSVSFSGALFGEGLVEVTDSSITENTSGADDGAGLRSNTDIVVTRSLVSGNSGGGVGGGAFAPGTVSVVDSTIAGNTAVEGAGLASESVSVVNSTVTGNTATGGGALRGGISAETVSLVYATVVANTAGDTANVGALELVSFGSVVALPQGGGANCSVGGTSPNGFDFSDDATCGFTAASDRESAGDPLLAALADNGGPTPTRAPEPGSPLIDAIPSVSCEDDGAAGITTDQRGVTRPQGVGCDIGAVEVLPTAPPAPVVMEPTFTG